jgi:hypothetical protein
MLNFQRVDSSYQLIRIDPLINPSNTEILNLDFWIFVARPKFLDVAIRGSLAWSPSITGNSGGRWQLDVPQPTGAEW